MPEVQRFCSPFQYGLNTRAGTDCVGHIIRTITDSDPESTLLAIDGVGAFDHVKRVRMLDAIARLPAARGLLPYARMSYNRVSQYLWKDAEGTTHVIDQGEGGEQGDPLMPAYFSLA